LVLIDAIWKIWMRIFIWRIQKWWTEHEILHPSQHGCVKGKSTDSASIWFLNALETAKELCTWLMMTSWDIMRAFDTVSKAMCKFAMLRLGIPEQLVDYIIQVDKQAHIYVRTPLALQLLKQGKLDTKYGFQAERGTGQGDVVSALIWTSIYDILLTALGKVTDDSFHTRESHGRLSPTPDIAYADDLVSIMATTNGLQAKADIVSGFCIIAGLKLAIGKFRAFGINWGNEWHEEGQHIQIYTHQWKANMIEMATDGRITHLGRTWDMHLTNLDEFRQIGMWCDNVLRYVVQRKATADTKILAIKLSIIPKLVYKLKFMGWPLKKYRELDLHFIRAYKQITRNMKTYPTDLLFLPSKYGGNGLTGITDAVQLAKLQLAVRGLTKQDTRHPMSSMLARGITLSGSHVRCGIKSKSDQIWYDECWARSLIEWTQEAGIRLVAHGNPPTGGELSVLESVRASKEGNVDEDFIRTMIYQGEVTMNDIRTEIEEGEVVETFLRVGQCWATDAMIIRGEVYEIVMLNAMYIQHMPWTTQGISLAPGVVLSRTGEHRMHGAGYPWTSNNTGFTQNFTELLRDGNAMQIITSGDKHLKTGGGVNTCTILRMQRREPVNCIMDQCVSTPIKFEGSIAIIREERKGSLREWGNDTQQNNESAIVWQDGESVQGLVTRGQQLRRDDNGVNLAIVMAGLLTERTNICNLSNIYKESIDKWNHGKGISKYSEWSMMALPQNQLKVTSGDEYNANQSKALKKTANIYEKQSALVRLLPQYPIDNIQFGIQNRMQFYWEDTSGQIADPAEEVYRTRLEKYTVRRDGHRNDKDIPERWHYAPVRMAADMWMRGKNNVGAAARIVRIMWDKHWKGDKQQAAGLLEVDTCNHCMVMTSQAHTIGVCQKPEILAIRKGTCNKFENYVQSVKGPSREVLNIIETIYCQHDSTSIWTGMWTPEVQEKFERAGGKNITIVSREYKMIVKGLRILTQGVEDMYNHNMSRRTEEHDSVASEDANNRDKRGRDIGMQRTLEECGIRLGDRKRDNKRTRLMIVDQRCKEDMSAASTLTVSQEHSVHSVNRRAKRACSVSSSNRKCVQRKRGTQDIEQTSYPNTPQRHHEPPAQDDRVIMELGEELGTATQEQYKQYDNG
jgi:hypothetical protein